MTIITASAASATCVRQGRTWFRLIPAFRGCRGRIVAVAFRRRACFPQGGGYSRRDAMALGLTRGLNEKGYSDAPDSFCAGCLAGVDRVAATRRAAFLRRTYATRRLRLTRALCCCPIESLSIENRTNAMRH